MMAKRYSGTFICIECGDEWELEEISELKCENCDGQLRPVGAIVEVEDESTTSTPHRGDT